MGQVNAMVLPFPALELRRDQSPRPRLEPAHDSVHVRFGEGRLCSSELLARTGCKSRAQWSSRRRAFHPGNVYAGFSTNSRKTSVPQQGTPCFAHTSTNAGLITISRDQISYPKSILNSRLNTVRTSR